jgi:hypothetical protein
MRYRTYLLGSITEDEINLKLGINPDNTKQVYIYRYKDEPVVIKHWSGTHSIKEADLHSDLIREAVNIGIRLEDWDWERSGIEQRVKHDTEEFYKVYAPRENAGE